MNIQEATIQDHSSQMILAVANERTKVVSTSYRLQGIVQHLGGQASGGHFIADIHDAKANRWFRCDDSIVRDVIKLLLCDVLSNSVICFQLVQKYYHQSN